VIPRRSFSLALPGKQLAVIAAALCLPVPLLALTGFVLPLPSIVERAVASLIPGAFGGEETLASSRAGRVQLTAAEARPVTRLPRPAAAAEPPASRSAIVRLQPAATIPRVPAPVPLPTRLGRVGAPAVMPARAPAAPAIEPAPDRATQIRARPAESVAPQPIPDPERPESPASPRADAPAGSGETARPLDRIAAEPPAPDIPPITTKPTPPRDIVATATKPLPPAVDAIAAELVPGDVEAIVPPLDVEPTAPTPDITGAVEPVVAAATEAVSDTASAIEETAPVDVPVPTPTDVESILEPAPLLTGKP
jgi:hypothetical protein